VTLDELLADLDGEVLRTWGVGSGLAGAPATLAVPADHQERSHERCLLIPLLGRRFAVPTRAVLAVSELPPVSAVPFSPPWLRGVARAAGGVVAVVDLARLLSTGPSPDAPRLAAEAAPLPPGETAREILLVVKTTEADLDAGLAVRGIVRLVSLAGTPGRPPATGEIDVCRAALVAGLVPDPTGAHLPLVAVLDIDRLLRRIREELDA
jgi:chemotaxis signal transduction protein